MFKDFFLFELKLRFRSISTYVFFLMPFLIAFFAVSTSDFGPIGAGSKRWPEPWIMHNLVITGA